MTSSKMKGRPLHPALDKKAMDELKTRKYVAASNMKLQWACSAYNDWRDTVIDTMDKCDEDILMSDLRFPDKLDKVKFCSSMCKFISKIKKHNQFILLPSTGFEIIKSVKS